MQTLFPLDRAAMQALRSSAEPALYDVWKLERALWLGEGDARDQNVRADAVCVMPEPFGIMRGSDELDRLHRISPYSDVSFAERAFSRARNTVVVAYRAEAIHRTTFEPYSALCSSTYAWEGGRLQLLLHQHTSL